VTTINSSLNSERVSNHFSCLSFITWGLLTSVVFSSYATAESLTEHQSQLFINNCVQCHSNPDTGAPVIGVESDWVAIKAKGEDKILNNVTQGIRGMPPLGYCSACSKDDFRVLIRLMTNMNDAKNDNHDVSKGVE